MERNTAEQWVISAVTLYSLSAPYDTDDGIPLSFRFSRYPSPEVRKIRFSSLFYYKLVARLVSGVVGNARVHYVHGYHLGSNGGSPSGLTYAHHRVGSVLLHRFLRTSPAFPNTVGTSSFKISAPCISFSSFYGFSRRIDFLSPERVKACEQYSHFIMPFFVCILSKSRGTCFEATLLSQYRFRQRFRIFPSALSAAHSIKFARYISAGESIFSPNTPQFFHAHEPCPPKYAVAMS